MPPNEFADQSYFPSAKARIILRFDEYGDPSVENDARQAVTKAPIKLKGIKDSTSPLEVARDKEAPMGVNRFVLRGASGGDGAPQKQDKSADNLTHMIGGIIPKTAQLTLNGIRQADTLSITLRFIDLPFDPRVIRSAGIEFYAGTLTPEEYRLGIEGQTRGSALGANAKNAYEPLNVIADTYIDENGNQRTNLRFTGWVDTWEVEWSEDGEALVRLECRDNTTLVIDQEAPPKLVMNMKVPVHESIAGYLANFPQFVGLEVEYRPGDEVIPILEEVLSKTAYRPNLGPAIAKAGGAPSKLSVWDYMTDVCGSIGHTVRLEGNTIIIQRARTLTSREFSGRPDDPFQGRYLQNGKILNRRFIYGRNVLSMKMARKFGKTAPTNVEVRCYNGRRKKCLVARFPLAKEEISKANPGDSKDQKWLVFRVSGIEDEKILRIIAQGAYEMVGRNELTVSIHTRNMASFGSNYLDPDLLDMKAGDTFELYVNRDEDEFNSLTVIESLLLAQARAREFLRNLGYENELADTYARAYSSQGFQTAFKLRQMAINWDIEEGIALDIQGVNFVEVRLDKSLPEGEEPDSANKNSKAKA